jgi:hypothetical protein
MAYIYDRPTDEYMYHAMYIMTMTGPPGENAVLRRVGLSEMRNEGWPAI